MTDSPRSFALSLILCGVLAPTSAAAQQYSYDAAGRLVEARYPSGALVRYDYDLLGNIVRVTRVAASIAPDAGARDASLPTDAAVLDGALVPIDGSVPTDAGVAPDAARADAGVFQTDGAVITDAAVADAASPLTDAGQAMADGSIRDGGGAATDASSPRDAAAADAASSRGDASVRSDAGTRPDAGANRPDAATSEGPTGGTRPDGCACEGGRNDPADVLVGLSVAILALQRVGRRRQTLLSRLGALLPVVAFVHADRAGAMPNEVAPMVEAGGFHALAILSDGSLHAWGSDDNGQLGADTTGIQLVPVRVGLQTGWKTAAAGYRHSLALRTDGSLFAFGQGTRGALGSGDVMDLFTPTAVAETISWRQVSAGSEHNAGIDINGKLWVWGTNTYGQMGGAPVDPGCDCAPAPVSSQAMDDLGPWRDVSAGDTHTVGVDANGQLWVWGQAWSTPLGIGGWNNADTPTRIGSDSDWRAVAAGSTQTLALKNDGTLWAWGANGCGEVGNNSYSEQFVPVMINSDTNWTYIAAGRCFSLARKADGAVFAWGDGSIGQLGMGPAVTTALRPMEVTTLGAGVTSLTADGWGNAVLAFRADGVLVAFGHNGSGVLGTGEDTNTVHFDPVPVAFGGTVVDTTPPTGTARTGRGRIYVDNTVVDLLLTCDDNTSACTEVRISEGVDGVHVAQPFAERVTFAVSPRLGPKLIAVRFVDAAGNVSAPFKVPVLLGDRPMPDWSLAPKYSVEFIPSPPVEDTYHPPTRFFPFDLTNDGVVAGVHYRNSSEGTTYMSVSRFSGDEVKVLWTVNTGVQVLDDREVLFHWAHAQYWVNGAADPYRMDQRLGPGPRRINPSMQVAGTLGTSCIMSAARGAEPVAPEDATGLPPTYVHMSFGADINVHGELAFTRSTCRGPSTATSQLESTYRAYVDDTRLFAPGEADFSIARGINASGDVVGTVKSDGVEESFVARGPFDKVRIPRLDPAIQGLWLDEAATDINDLGMVVGHSYTVDGPRAYAWTSEWGLVPIGPQPTPDGNAFGWTYVHCSPTAMNYFGEVLVRCDGVDYSDDFVWRGPGQFAPVGGTTGTGIGAFRRLPDNVTLTAPGMLGINDKGELVGDVHLEDPLGVVTGDYGVILRPDDWVEGPITRDSYPRAAARKDPVNTYTGEFYMHAAPDLDLGGGIPMRFQRYYASRVGAGSALGRNWRHGFDWAVTRSSDHIEVRQPEGARLRFYRVADAWRPGSQASEAWRLDGPASVGDPFVLVSPDGSRRLRIGSQVESIDDFEGHRVDLTWNTSGQLERVIDDTGRQLLLQYDGGGQLASVSDGTRTVTFAYVGGLLASVTDALGETTVYSYDPARPLSALLLAITDASGRTPMTQTYDARGRVLTQTTADGRTSAFEYLAPITRLTDSNGAVSEQQHDEYGRMTRHTAAGGDTRVVYDRDGRVVEVEDPLGRKTLLEWDADRIARVEYPGGRAFTFEHVSRALPQGGSVVNLSRVVYPDGTSERFEWSPAGKLVRTVDARGMETRAAWDNRGNLSSWVLPTGAEITSAYDSADRLVAWNGGSGAFTYVYDSLGRLRTLTSPDGSAVTADWDDHDRLVAVTDGLGRVTRHVYDAAGRLVSSTLPSGAVDVHAYDLQGRLERYDDFEGRTRFVANYDGEDHLVSLEGPGGASIAFEYDEAGRLVKWTDENGGAWQRNLDLAGQPVSVSDPLGRSLSLTRDSGDRVTAVQWPGGARTNYEYDERGRLVAVVDPTGRRSTFTRDAAGNVIGTSEGSGMLTASYQRDALGLVTSVIDPAGNTWSWTRDVVGRVTARATPSGVEENYAYDSLGRHVLTRWADASSVSIEYDAIGRVTRQAYSDGTVFTFDTSQLDTMGRLTAEGLDITVDATDRVTRSNGIDIVYGSDGNMSSSSLAPGKTITYAYDPAGRVVGVSDWLGGTTRFDRDASGAVVVVTFPNGVQTRNSYGADGRLASISVDGQSNLGSVTLARDGDGRIIGAERHLPLEAEPTDEVLEFSFDGACRHSDHPYDARGALLQDGTRSYDWDAAVQLRSYTEASGTVQFDYDALGRPIRRTSSAGEERMTWNYATPTPVPAVLEGATGQRFVVSLPDGTVLYTVDSTTGARLFHHFDERGNTAFVTDDAGIVVGAFAYLPYGKIERRTGPATTPFTFAGRFGVLEEAGTGLYRMGVRMYDSRSGRFLSPEPLAGALGPRAINPYAYVYGDPLRLVDEDGLSGKDAVDTRKATLINDRFAEFGLVANRVKSLSSPQGFLSLESSPLAFRKLPDEHMSQFVAAQLNRAQGVLSSKLPGIGPPVRTLSGFNDMTASVSRNLSAVDTGGKVLTVVSWGVETVNFDSRLQSQMSVYKRNKQGAEHTYAMTVDAIEDMRKRKVITAEEARKLIEKAGDNLVETMSGFDNAGIAEIGILVLEHAVDQLANYEGLPSWTYKWMMPETGF